MKHVLRFTQDKATKNFIRFEERKDLSDTPVVGKIYISKSALDVLSNPKRIKITIEVDEF